MMAYVCGWRVKQVAASGRGRVCDAPARWMYPHGTLRLSVAMPVAGALGFGSGAHGMEPGRGGADCGRPGADRARRWIDRV